MSWHREALRPAKPPPPCPFVPFEPIRCLTSSQPCREPRCNLPHRRLFALVAYSCILYSTDANARLACLQSTDGRMTMSTHRGGVLPRCPTPWTRPPCQAETHKERSSSSRLSFLFRSETNACHFCWQHFSKPTFQHFVGSKLTEAHHRHVITQYPLRRRHSGEPGA